MKCLALVVTVLLGSNATLGVAPSLVGSWTFPHGDTVTNFVFSKEGTCTFATRPKDGKAVEEPGTFVAEDGKVTITLKDRTLVFLFVVQYNRLTLTGGKLPREGATFTKDETIDFRKLVGNWVSKIPGDSSKVYRFRSDGTFSREDLDDDDKIKDTGSGGYALEEDNTITLKEGSLPTVYKIKLKDNALTLRGGAFPPDGRTFVRKKETGAGDKTVTPVTKDPKPEDKPDSAKLPGDAAWNLSPMKGSFLILKTTYDPEAREVVWVLEARKELSGGLPPLFFKFYDADEVRLATVKIEYRPKSDASSLAAVPKGERVRGVLVLPSENNVQDMKKVVVSEKE